MTLFCEYNKSNMKKVLQVKITVSVNLRCLESLIQIKTKRKEVWRMPNLTTPIPPKLSGDTREDINALKRWGTALVDELSYLFNNLDVSNVVEARSVKAENIETKDAKISNAQIGNLSAEKLVTGKINTGLVDVEDKDGLLSISGSEIVISDRERERFVASFDKSTNTFRFELYNKNGEPTVHIDSRGNALFKGVLEGAEMYASTIIGTDSGSYKSVDGGVFADIDQTGIKIMQDDNGIRQQKIGMSVSDDGIAYMILGAGDGSGGSNINGVVYTNGAFKIEKNESYTNMGIVGKAPFIHFWEDTGELWLNGNRVLINGRDLQTNVEDAESDIQDIKKEINRIWATINSTETE